MFKLFLGVALIAVAVLSKSQYNQYAYCQVCEFVIGAAQHNFNANTTDKAALRTNLIIDCRHLRTYEQQHCVDLVYNNIDKIYSDLVAGDHSDKTCGDIGDCPPIPK